MSRYWNTPIVHMVAAWKQTGLDLFDIHAWGSPQVDASAAPHVLKGKPPEIIEITCFNINAELNLQPI